MKAASQDALKRSLLLAEEESALCPESEAQTRVGLCVLLFTRHTFILAGAGEVGKTQQRKQARCMLPLLCAYVHKANAGCVRLRAMWQWVWLSPSPSTSGSWALSMDDPL